MTYVNQTNLGGLKYNYSVCPSKGIPADGSEITLQPQLPEGVTDTGQWLWNTGETTREITVRADHSYIYRVSYTAANGTVSQQAFAIAVCGDAPADVMTNEITVEGVIERSTEKTVLEGTSVILYAGAATGWTDDYLWDNGQKNSAITIPTITSSRTYTCQYANQSGAVSESVFHLNVVPAMQTINDTEGSEIEVLSGSSVTLRLVIPSYMDSDGNGIGDLPGITSKIDYLQSLGITALWLNPIYVSGWQDGGYDVIDFYKVDPRFGTNTDLVDLADALHQRGMKLCLDLVAGHTSDKNEWFLQSKSGKDLRYSDYYIWTDEITDAEKEQIKRRYEAPDPSASTIGRFVEANAPRAKYYEKNFYESQPALNYGYANPDPTHPWEQPVTAPGPRATRQELKSIMEFWFSKGVDGFRVDLASSLVKNDPDKKEVSKLWQEMRQWRDQNFPDRALIAEWFNPEQSLPAGFDIDFYRIGGRGASAINLFRLNTTNAFGGGNMPKAYFDRAGQGEVKGFVAAFDKTYTNTREVGYLSLPTGNHDSERMSQDPRTMQDLKVAMTFLLTLPGTPFIYYGDEIGMKQQFGLPSKEGSNARSGCRTPMQWSNNETAGFSSASVDKLYLPVATEHGTITVEAEEKDPNSLLNYVKGLLKLRSQSEALNNDGSWNYVGNVEQPYPMVYRRSSDYEDYIVALNPSGKKVKATINSQGASVATIVYNTGKGTYKIQPKGKGDTITLDPCSAIIVKLTGCQQCDD